MLAQHVSLMSWSGMRRSLIPVAGFSPFLRDGGSQPGHATFAIINRISASGFSSVGNGQLVLDLGFIGARVTFRFFGDSYPSAPGSIRYVPMVS